MSLGVDSQHYVTTEEPIVEAVEEEVACSNSPTYSAIAGSYSPRVDEFDTRLLLGNLSNLRFPLKLWRIVSDCTSGAIHWIFDGTAIAINYQIFEKEYLDASKRLFKTNNITSFVRQLNLYGFRKVPKNTKSQLEPSLYLQAPSADYSIFHHDSFRSDRPDLLLHVNRRGIKPDGSGGIAICGTAKRTVHRGSISRPRREPRRRLTVSSEQTATTSSDTDTSETESSASVEQVIEDGIVDLDQTQVINSPDTNEHLVVYSSSTNHFEAMDCVDLNVSPSSIQHHQHNHYVTQRCHRDHQLCDDETYEEIYDASEDVAVTIPLTTTGVANITRGYFNQRSKRKTQHQARQLNAKRVRVKSESAAINAGQHTYHQTSVPVKPVVSRILVSNHQQQNTHHMAHNFRHGTMALTSSTQHGTSIVRSGSLPQATNASLHMSVTTGIQTQHNPSIVRPGSLSSSSASAGAAAASLHHSVAEEFIRKVRSTSESKDDGQESNFSATTNSAVEDNDFDDDDDDLGSDVTMSSRPQFVFDLKRLGVGGCVDGSQQHAETRERVRVERLSRVFEPAIVAMKQEDLADEEIQEEEILEMGELPNQDMHEEEIIEEVVVGDDEAIKTKNTVLVVSRQESGEYLPFTEEAHDVVKEEIVEDSGEVVVHEAQIVDIYKEEYEHDQHDQQHVVIIKSDFDGHHKDAYENAHVIPSDEEGFVTASGSHSIRSQSILKDNVLGTDSTMTSEEDGTGPTFVVSRSASRVNGPSVNYTRSSNGSGKVCTEYIADEHNTARALLSLTCAKLQRDVAGMKTVMEPTTLTTAGLS